MKTLENKALMRIYRKDLTLSYSMEYFSNLKELLI